MEPFGYEHSVVRVVCYQCGWFRVIGYTGSKYTFSTRLWTRALIRVRKARDACNVLSADVIEFETDDPTQDVSNRIPGYRDLEHEAHRDGLVATLGTMDSLAANQICPRCKQRGSLRTDTWLAVGFDFDRYKTWRVVHRLTRP
jgi:hypothetical protein